MLLKSCKCPEIYEQNRSYNLLDENADLEANDSYCLYA